MRKLSDIYLILQECFIIFKSTNLCTEIQYLINSNRINRDEFDLLVKDFGTFKPEGKQKGEFWFKDWDERAEFLKNRIDNLKNEGL